MFENRKVKGNEGTVGLPCQPGEVDKAKPIRNMYTKSNKISKNKGKS